MTIGDVSAEFREASADPRPRDVPLSHLSVEVGHLYLEDLAAGPDRLQSLFAEARPWLQAATADLQGRLARPRISTCFLIDDYFSQLADPAGVISDVLAAAERAGVRIHYLVREAACAVAEGPFGPVAPAELLLSRLVEEPEPGTTGWRPAATESGWLSNGRRSPQPPVSQAAMDVTEWAPPRQNVARRHSIFVDVQLWDDQAGVRTWSCPLLAACWQLMRLGLLRHRTRPVAEAADAPVPLPSSWAKLPAVLRLDPKAPPFCAYRTMSLLSPRFLPVEVAVRTILAQVEPDPAVARQLGDRAAAERIELSPDILERIEYVFTGSSPVDPPG